VGGDGMGPVYSASFTVQTSYDTVLFVNRLFRFVKLLLFSGTKAESKEAVKKGANIFTDAVQRKLDQ
jgi:hypothetical protein